MDAFFMPVICEDTNTLIHPYALQSTQRSPLYAPTQKFLQWGVLCEDARQATGPPRICYMRAQLESSTKLHITILPRKISITLCVESATCCYNLSRTDSVRGHDQETREQAMHATMILMV